jgi:glycosyltransferase involved in cell wall biosynthesis
MVTRKKRVLFVTSSLQLGGAERQLLLLCQHLKTQVDIQIVSLDSDGPLKQKYLQVFPDTIILTEKNAFNQINRLTRIIRVSKPDVVVTWLYKADLVAGVAAKFAGRFPVLWSARNSSIPDFSFLKKFILSILSQIIPKKIIANGSPALSFHLSIGYPKRKLIIIPNLLANWTETTKSESSLLQGKGTIRNLNVGIAARQVAGKGIIETIDKLHNVKIDFTDIDLSVIGQESKESQIWQEHGMYRGISVKELTLDHDLAIWFKGLDLYLMPSTSWESQPNSLLEAISIGCPILVSSSIQLDLSIPEIFTFDPNDYGSLTKKIAYLLNKREVIAPEVIAMQKTITEIFEAKKVIKSWKVILELA